MEQSQALHQQHPHHQHVTQQQQQQYYQRGDGHRHGHGHGRVEQGNTKNNTSSAQQAKDNRLLRSHLMQLRPDFDKLRETKEAYAKELAALRQHKGHSGPGLLDPSRFLFHGGDE
jgi:hypothetical protein